MWVYQAGEQRIVARAQAVHVYQHNGGWYVDLLWDLNVTRALKRSPLYRSDFGQTPQNPVRANAGTLAALRCWGRSSKVGVPGSTQAPSPEDTRLRVLADIVRRQGQQDFRQRLLSAYGGRCAISECDVEGVLEAAHISPYRGLHTSGTENGLLLRADLHTLFDLNLIAVGRNDVVVLSSALAGSAYEEFAGRKIGLRTNRGERPSRDLLAKHRESLAP